MASKSRDRSPLARYVCEHESSRTRHRRDLENGHHDKQAEQTIMPFLTEHIPNMYNGGATTGQKTVASASTGAPPAQPPPERANTRYCYRHRPDMKCRRQADEPSMDQLQNELATLSQSDQRAISHVWSVFSAAPSKHRSLIFQGLLTQCCFPQLSSISAHVRDLIKIDFLAALPAELGFKILCSLDTTSLCKSSQVSRRWRSLADDDVVWHRMCEQHIDRKCLMCGWGLPLLERKRLRVEKRQIQLRAQGRSAQNISSEQSPALPSATGSLVAEGGSLAGSKRAAENNLRSPATAKRSCSPLPTAVPSSLPTQESIPTRHRRPWKDVYKDRFKVGTAWKYGRFRTMVFKGHTNGVMCVQFDDNVLISGSYDTTIRVWNVNTGAELRTLTGHTSGVRCLQFDDQKLMTGSLDHTLKLWNWRSGQCLRTFNAHTEGIIALHFTNRYVATGSMDKTIRVWDADTKQTFLLREHSDYINSVKIDEPSHTLFSASDDLTVRFWDLENRECIRVFHGHVGPVQQVQLLPVECELDDANGPNGDKEDDPLALGPPVGFFHHHVSHQDTQAPTAEPFWKNCPDRPAPPRYILTGALDSTIRLWDVHLHKHAPAPPHAPTPKSLTMLPTDPLTNSHTPRAQACVRTFFGHVEGIWALSADHLRLISGSQDRMMKVWDPRTGKCERTFTGHAGPVTCTWLSDSRVASGSDDCEVRMLCFDQ